VAKALFNAERTQLGAVNRTTTRSSDGGAIVPAIMGYFRTVV
jgi:hypothetical protein